MPTQTLNRTNGPALTFDGDLLTETPGQVDDKGRRYVVAIYRSEQGYVVEIRFWQSANVAPVILAEFVEQPEDVEKVLFVFEPLEHLPAEWIGDLNAEARRVLTSHLFKLYDKEVACALKELGLATDAASPSVQSHRRVSGVGPRAES